MNWITPLLLLVVTWLAVFASTQFAPLAGWLGTRCRWCQP